jgi:hypothetical protein
LCGEPWCYTPQEAGRLTYYQVDKLLCADRDEKGQLVVKARSDRLSDEERFSRTWRRRGVSRWRIAELWQEECRKAAAAENKDKGKRR